MDEDQVAQEVMEELELAQARTKTMREYVNAQREIDELFGVAPTPAEFQSQM